MRVPVNKKMLFTTAEVFALSQFAGLRLVHHDIMHDSSEHGYTFAVEHNSMYVGLLHVTKKKKKSGLKAENVAPVLSVGVTVERQQRSRPCRHVAAVGEGSSSSKAGHVEV